MSDSTKQVTLYAVAWSGPNPVVVSGTGLFNGYTIRELVYATPLASGAFGNRTVITKKDMPGLGFAFTEKLAMQRALEREERLAALSQERMEAAQMAVAKIHKIIGIQ
jgi:hypothetical protein